MDLDGQGRRRHRRRERHRRRAGARGSPPRARRVVARRPGRPATASGTCDVTDAGRGRTRWSRTCSPSTAASTCSARTPASPPASALDDPDDLWHAAFEVNVMAHVYAARAVVPHMLERGGGLPAQHRVRGRAADLARRRAVRRHQARRGRVRRVAGGDVRRPRHRGQRAVPDGRGDAAADGSARGRRRRCAGGGGVREIVSAEHVADAVVAGLAAETVPDPAASRGRYVLGAEGVRPGPLARRRAPAHQSRSARGHTCQECRTASRW